MNEKQLKQEAEQLSVDQRVHILHDKKHHKYTVAYVITGADDDTITVRASGAFCSERDMFCKKTGRLISMGRLVNEPSVVSQEEQRGQCGIGPIATGTLLLDTAMPVRAEQWRWVDQQVIEAMNLDEFDDVPW